MSLVNYAEQELKAAGMFSKDSDYRGMLGDAVLDLIRCFADQGHSGFSAAQTVRLFEKLALYEPLGPLQGTDDEWVKVDDITGLQQNIRCSRVFRDADGEAYDIDGYVFIDKQGCGYTGRGSRRKITFPYAPKTEYVKEHSLKFYWLRLFNR